MYGKVEIYAKVEFLVIGSFPFFDLSLSKFMEHIIDFDLTSFRLKSKNPQWFPLFATKGLILIK